jgi:hypothetical protein
MLQMQSAQHAASRARQVVLDERPDDPVRRIVIRPEGFDKEAPLIPMSLGSMISTSGMAAGMTFMALERRGARSYHACMTLVFC